MTKEEVIKKANANGYSIDFSLQSDCLYCSTTETGYQLSNFKIIDEYPFQNDGVSGTLKTVDSTEYALSGYFII